jgi:hypothetical protein
MSTQIIALKDRTDLRESSRILALRLFALSCGVGDTLSARGPCDAHSRISEPSNRRGLQLYHEYNPKLVRCFMLVPAIGYFGLPMVKGLHASNTAT